jgi:hypothetical protein
MYVHKGNVTVSNTPVCSNAATINEVRKDCLCTTLANTGCPVLRIRIRIRIHGIRMFLSLRDPYGSSYGSFHHKAKIVRKTLISTFCDFFVTVKLYLNEE